jgi:hypothetical protein
VVDRDVWRVGQRERFGWLQCDGESQHDSAVGLADDRRTDV